MANRKGTKRTPNIWQNTIHIHNVILCLGLCIYNEAANIIFNLAVLEMVEPEKTIKFVPKHLICS